MKFLDEVKEVQALLAVVAVVGMVAMMLMSKPVPDEFRLMIGMIVAFYFGQKASAPVTEPAAR
jgi:uncharacterized membrane protein